MLGYAESRVIGGTPPAPPESFYVKTTKQTSFTITLLCSVYNKVTINWGDGTSTLVNSSAAKTKTYTVAGEYTVTIAGELYRITSFTCNNQSVTEFGLHSELINLTKIDLGNNTSLAGQVFIPETLSKLVYISFAYTNITYFECLATLPQSSSLLLDFQSCPYLETFKANYVVVAGNIYVRFTPLTTFEMQSLTSYMSLSANDTNLTELNLPNATTNSSGTGLYFYSNPYLQVVRIPNLTTSRIISGSNCPNLTSIIYSNNLHLTASVDLRNNSMFPIIPYSVIGAYLTFSYENMGLTQSEVDSILAAFKSVVIVSGTNKNTISLSNFSGATGALNSVPSQTGKDDAAWLRLNGWKVSILV